MATSTENREQGPRQNGRPQRKGPAPDAREEPQELLPNPIAGPRTSSLQSDVRPRASEKAEVKKRDRVMAWGFILALVVVVIVSVVLGRVVE